MQRFNRRAAVELDARHMAELKAAGAPGAVRLSRERSGAGFVEAS